MKKIIFLVTALFSLQMLFAQDTTMKKSTDTGSITVYKDPRLDLLVKKQILINSEARKSGKGYRLMVMSSVNQNEVIAAKTRLYTYFPELKTYLWHQSPYYKLKAGNFRERKDAEIYQKKLEAYFPKGVFVMNDDNVEFKLDKSKEEDL